MAKELCRRIFKNAFLSDVNRVLHNVDDNLTILYLKHYFHIRFSGEKVVEFKKDEGIGGMGCEDSSDAKPEMEMEVVIAGATSVEGAHQAHIPDSNEASPSNALVFWV
ncbi:hypothetical protein SUGI_0999800 [Cryptomeria japonica]|nr:hypothetical protein SUGI_0999800 [Cryptomeria japonica]